MSKKISAFWQNFRIYIVILITSVIILIAAGVVLWNITKNKEEDPVRDIQEMTQSQSSEGQDELTDENFPVEPVPPTIQLPTIRQEQGENN